MNAEVIRRATLEDVPVLVEFNRAMAAETEHLELLPEVVSAGVQAVFENSMRGFYLICQVDELAVGSLLITTEWSDWRNGNFWWVQSVYVRPAYRRRGIYSRMYRFVKELAESDQSVCGFRLYVEKANHRAQQIYQSLGMRSTPYLMYEELKSSIKFCTE
ncbi:MAG: GNAT family N-acetyltransferase [Aureliella sp.]